MTPDTTLPVPRAELEPCPFCGAGETQFKENGKMWLGMKYSEPTSVSAQHWCAETPGQPKRMIERVGRDHASAVAAWNARACMAPLQERADALQAERASLADTVAEAVRNTCSMPHPNISLSTDLKPHIWSLSFEANAQKKRADALEAALKAALKHAKKNGMQGWPVFADMERLINPTGGES